MECFGSSQEFSKLRYTSYLGDGNSKASNEVVTSDPYNGVTISTLECTGHIQKRVGGSFRKMCKMCKKQTDSKGKPLGGKEFQVNDKMINKLQNYYGNTIRENAGTSVYEMK